MSPWEVATTSTACCPWEGVGQCVCKENAFRRGRSKQREANRRLRIRCTAANGEVPGGIMRFIINSPNRRKKEVGIMRKQSRQGKGVDILNPKSFTRLKVLKMFPTNMEIVTFTVTSK